MRGKVGQAMLIIHSNTDVSKKEGWLMAIVLIEEVLMGLDDVRDSLGQAVTVLEALVEDVPSTMGENLKEVMEQTLLIPLQSRVAVLDKLLDEVATMS
jgi:hypothetical protein